MTGFGKHTCEQSNQKVTFEIKSLNSKQLDLTLKIPSLFREKELELRTMLSPLLQRGKVEGIMNFESDEKAGSAIISKSVVRQYVSELKAISEEQNLPQTNLLSIVMRMPDVLSSDGSNLSEETWNLAQDAVLKAVEKFNAFREHEGRVLENDFRQRIAQIQNLLKSIEPHEKTRIEKIRKTMKSNLEKWVDAANVDTIRYEQELFYYLEKLDITEEKVRLEKHCTYFLDTLVEEGAGKKLGFVTQEIGREINTIGSKANDLDIQKIVVQMKDELEKVKEQLGNVL